MIAGITDAIIIVLLAGTTLYGYWVSRKVKKLMSALNELEPLVQAYAMAVDKSEDSVNLMRSGVVAAATAKATADLEKVEPLKEEPEFHPRRSAPENGLGIQSLSDKKDLVRGFFEQTRMELRA